MLVRIYPTRDLFMEGLLKPNDLGDSNDKVIVWVLACNVPGNVNYQNVFDSTIFTLKAQNKKLF